MTFGIFALRNRLHFSYSSLTLSTSSCRFGRIFGISTTALAYLILVTILLPMLISLMMYTVSGKFVPFYNVQVLYPFH